MARLRTARTLIFGFHTGRLTGCNFLSSPIQEFDCEADVIGLLVHLGGEGRMAGDLAEGWNGWTEAELCEAIDALIAMEAVLVEGSPADDRDRKYGEGWTWSMPSAALHFCLRDQDHISIEAAEAHQIAKLEHAPSPPLLTTHADRPDAVPLHLPPRNDLFETMARRRTERSSCGEPVTQAQLADCLFAGFGIVGFTTNVTGRLPLKMTPSGGARNPFEAYVLVQSIPGLARGMYHYSGASHSLLPVAGSAPSGSELTGGQDWANAMSAIIILVAELDRTMWKYADANGYRVVMIEAGHIGQNVMLAATAHGLSACPTAALSHSAIAKACGLAKLTSAPLYALGLTVPEFPLTSPAWPFGVPAVSA